MSTVAAYADIPELEPSDRETGHVIWFDDSRGYGHICPEGKDPKDRSSNVYVHYTAIISGDRWRSLATGQLVSYQPTRGPKGIVAQAVRAVKREDGQQ